MRNPAFQKTCSGATDPFRVPRVFAKRCRERRIEFPPHRRCRAWHVNCDKTGSLAETNLRRDGFRRFGKKRRRKPSFLDHIKTALVRAFLYGTFIYAPIAWLFVW